MTDHLNDSSDLDSQKYKDFIDSIFETKKKKGKKPNKAKYKLALPETMPLEKKKEEEAMSKGKEEMELIRQAFLDFQDRISDTEIYGFLFRDVEEFAESCKLVHDILINNIEYDELTEEGRMDYTEFQNLRNRILTSIYKKYYNS